MPSCYTVDRLVKLRMDGVKFMIRLNPMDERSKYTVRYCAEAVNAAESAGLPIFYRGAVCRNDGNGVLR